MEVLLFADHVEARQMGEHMRELRFPEPFAMHSIKVIRRGEKVGSNFEGRTYPDIRMIGLEVYVADVMAPGSTMLPLKASSVGTYQAPHNLVSNSVVLRGKFIKLSVAIYGQALESASIPPMPVAPHLRPTATFEEKLDMAEEGGPDFTENLEDFERSEDFKDFECSPATFARALGLGAVQEANSRLADHNAWLGGLQQSAEVLEAETVARLEALSQDVVLLAQRAPENAGHVHLGPELARSLLSLVSRCLERLEFKPLKAALQALTTCLISATAAAQVLKGRSLDVIIAILKDAEWGQQSLKLAALQALLQLCSHVAGMEAFLGWADTSTPTAYEVVLSLTLDGMQPKLEMVALALLRRAALYEALARCDDYCSKLEGLETEAPQERLHRLAAEALEDTATHLESLSQPIMVRDVQSSCVLLGDDILNSPGDDSSRLPAIIFGGGGTGPVANDPFSQGQCHLHGFLESFLTGRRLLSGLCTLMRRLPRMPPEDRLMVFRPFQRLICTLLSCTGGPQFLAADNATITSLLSILEGGPNGNLPAVPRFPAALVRDVGAPQLAALLGLHMRALRLSLHLVASTRSKGRGGLLPEEHAFPVLAALHRLCMKGSAGRCAVVYAFRSIFFAEWLMRQIEGRLDEAPNGSGRLSRPVPPSLRHLVAILHALVLSDPSGAAAEKFGARILALAQKAIRLLEPGELPTQAASLLEFALDSEGAEGGLGKAVRMGRHSADLECLKNLKELAAQLRPWEDDSSGSMASNAKLMASLVLTKGPRALKRSDEERGSRRMKLVLGGHSGASNGVEVPEVDFKAESAAGEDLADDHERYPSDDLTELPLLATRVICRRAAAGPKDALELAVPQEADGASKDGLAHLVPWLIRCAGALSLNLEAAILREDKKPIASIYATRRAHLQLLETALQTCAHFLCALREAGLAQYRHTELCQTVLLLVQRLTSGLSGLAPRGSFNSDPEFRLLWRHCIVWVCRVFRLWFQAFPQAAGGQLLLPLLRHARVLPSHFAGDLLLLATCGTLKPVLPAAYHFSIQFTQTPAGDGLHSHAVLLPTGTRTGNHGVVTLRLQNNGQGGYGQFWATDSEVQDWEEGAALPEARDPLVRALAQDRESGAAQALGLVELVNSRRERLCLDDIGELLAVVSESALTSDALLHMCTAKVMEKLTAAGLPVLLLIRRLFEAALNGVVMETEEDNGNISGGAARDSRDARAVSRLLLLLAHFGAMSTSARLALTEHSVETLCQSVLAHSPATSLPPMAFSQAIRLLGLMFASPSSHSVPKCRMVAKAVNLLINKAESASASTMAASLELLSALCAPQWLCLNLLFSSSAENVEEETVQVSVSSAFKLTCQHRLASELGAAAISAAEDEEGLEELGAWLRAAELMASLQRMVAAHCPSATVFFEVVLSGGSASRLMEEIEQALQKVPSLANGMIPEQVARIEQEIKDARRELLAKPADPLPSSLPTKIFVPPLRGKSISEAKDERCRDAMEESERAVGEAVALLDAAADLEANSEWADVVELDSAEAPGEDTKMDWEFDAAALRKRRQGYPEDFLEKFESDRKAKRLKQQQEKREAQVAERAPAPGAGATPAASAPRDAPKEKEGEKVTKASASGSANPAEGLQAFLKDHPEFMRVLQNPKKCLADPRVKSMFVAELQNYPAVKTFLASKGLQLS